MKGRFVMNQQILNKTLQKLRDNQVRMTHQRQAILEYMIATQKHPTADDVYHALVDRFPNISVATIYNNLRFFTEIGLIEEMTYGDASSRFDFAETKHYHAICNKCGKAVDVFYPDLADIENITSNLTGFEVTSHRIEVYGICPECQKI